jgi:hypothetical protein
MLALVIGNLVLNNLSALAMGSASIVFLGSFLVVSVKNDNKGMMKWISYNSNQVSEK